MPPRIAFSTLAFPDATLAAAVSLGRRWGYAGIELRLIDGELIDPSMPASRRAQVRQTLAGLPVVAVDSSIRLTGDDPGPELRRFLELASDWEAPLVRVFGGTLGPPALRQQRLRAAARVLEDAVPLAARLGVAIGVLLAQVKDARRTADGDWQLVLLGAGEVPVAEMLGLLQAAGYPHWISVEWEKRWHPGIEEPEVALPQHLDLLTRWLGSGR
jgi:sugar phosphate isomerase/epimerase